MRAPIETGIIAGQLGTALLVHLDNGREIRAAITTSERAAPQLVLGERVVIALSRSSRGMGRIMRRVVAGSNKPRAARRGGN